MTFDSSNTDFGGVYDGLILMVTKDGEEYNFYYTPQESLVGHYTGSDGQIELLNGNVFKDVTYDFTVSDNGDGMFLVNGWFETTDGIRYTIDNILCSNE